MHHLAQMKPIFKINNLFKISIEMNTSKLFDRWWD
jgi:hypothetical protein